MCATARSAQLLAPSPRAGRDGTRRDPSQRDQPRFYVRLNEVQIQHVAACAQRGDEHEIRQDFVHRIVVKIKGVVILDVLAVDYHQCTHHQNNLRDDCHILEHVVVELFERAEVQVEHAKSANGREPCLASLARRRHPDLDERDQKLRERDFHQLPPVDVVLEPRIRKPRQLQRFGAPRIKNKDDARIEKQRDDTYSDERRVDALPTGYFWRRSQISHTVLIRAVKHFHRLCQSGVEVHVEEEEGGRHIRIPERLDAEVASRPPTHLHELLRRRQVAICEKLEKLCQPDAKGARYRVEDWQQDLGAPASLVREAKARQRDVPHLERHVGVVKGAEEFVEPHAEWHIEGAKNAEELAERDSHIKRFEAHPNELTQQREPEQDGVDRLVAHVALRAHIGVVDALAVRTGLASELLPALMKDRVAVVSDTQLPETFLGDRPERVAQADCADGTVHTRTSRLIVIAHTRAIARRGAPGRGHNHCGGIAGIVDDRLEEVIAELLRMQSTQ
eukprot:5482100-Prymnesium_polylepis.1